MLRHSPNHGTQRLPNDDDDDDDDDDDKDDDDDDDRKRSHCRTSIRRRDEIDTFWNEPYGRE